MKDIEKSLRNCGNELRSLSIDEIELRTCLNSKINTDLSSTTKNTKYGIKNIFKPIIKVSTAMILFLVISGSLIIFFKSFMSSSKYSDIIVMNDVVYQAVCETDIPHSTENSIDDMINKDMMVGKIKRNTRKSLFLSRNHILVNGDAVALKRGTKIYALKNYDPKFRVAAFKDGGYVLYEVCDNPNAKKGADILAIKDMVAFITINDIHSAKNELGKIEDPVLISKLTGLILEAPFKSTKFAEPVVVICFHLKDGSKVNRLYQTHTGILDRGIATPEEFQNEINKLLNNNPLQQK